MDKKKKTTAKPIRPEKPKEEEPQPVAEATPKTGVKLLLDKFENSIATDAGAVKFSIADYIRLIQVDREINPEEPTHVEVKWIDHAGLSSEGAD